MLLIINISLTALIVYRTKSRGVAHPATLYVIKTFSKFNMDEMRNEIEREWEKSA